METNLDEITAKRRHAPVAVSWGISRMRVPTAAKSIGLAFLLGGFALMAGGCAGGYYEAGYSSGYYAPNYAPYYGYYGYNRLAYPYAGYGGTIIVRGVRHHRGFGHHHFHGRRHFHRHHHRGTRHHRHRRHG